MFNEYPTLKPVLCTRYADNLFVATEELQSLEILKRELEKSFVLYFTYERAKFGKIAFLVCLVTRMNKKFRTKVYVKDINNGYCIKYKSLSPKKK